MDFLKAASMFLLLVVGVSAARDALQDERYRRLRRDKGYIDWP